MVGLQRLALCAHLFCVCVAAQQARQAGAVLRFSSLSTNATSAAVDSVAGIVVISELTGSSTSLVTLSLSLSGLRPNAAHAFHLTIHGDPSSTSSHFDPYNTGKHACPQAPSTDSSAPIVLTADSHLGDLGTVRADASGTVSARWTSQYLSLDPTATSFPIGRGAVLHALADDCTSLPGGNAGVNVARGVIAWDGEAGTGVAPDVESLIAVFAGDVGSAQGTVLFTPVTNAQGGGGNGYAKEASIGLLKLSNLTAGANVTLKLLPSGYVTDWTGLNASSPGTLLFQGVADVQGGMIVRNTPLKTSVTLTELVGLGVLLSGNGVSVGFAPLGRRNATQDQQTPAPPPPSTIPSGIVFGVSFGIMVAALLVAWIICRVKGISMVAVQDFITLDNGKEATDLSLFAECMGCVTPFLAIGAFLYYLYFINQTAIAQKPFQWTAVVLQLILFAVPVVFVYLPGQERPRLNTWRAWGQLFALFFALRSESLALLFRKYGILAHFFDADKMLRLSRLSVFTAHLLKPLSVVCSCCLAADLCLRIMNDLNCSFGLLLVHGAELAAKYARNHPAWTSVDSAIGSWFGIILSTACVLGDLLFAGYEMGKLFWRRRNEAGGTKMGSEAGVESSDGFTTTS
ncbi:hypothetical protein BC830DRAFT_1164282 [Chytriomyces sp. MP71]|nr:hypothetical protein BC830DRAFT_1164282 [Chytriomyces sp. MP71]